MKRVLNISNLRMDNGGIETFMMGVYRNSNKNLLKFDFLVDRNTKGYYDNEIINNGDRLLHATFEQNKKVPKFLSLFIQNITYFFDLVKVLKNEGPYDIVHCHSLRLSGLSMLAAAIMRVPVRITHSHIAPKVIKKHFSWYGLLNFYFSRLLIKMFATNKLGCSQEANFFLYGKHSTNDKKCKVIFNGIELSKFNPEKYDKVKILEKYNLPNKRNIFLNVGRFTKQKNQIFLLEVMNKMKKLNPNIHLILVGYGELENKLKGLVKEYDITQNVTFLPHDTNIPEVLSVTDSFIFPSLYEGLGIVLIEAQAMRVPCYASTMVPKEVNIGLCSFLNLQDGSTFWAERIIESINSDNTPQSLNLEQYKKYDVKETYKNMERIYLGG